MLRIGLTGGIGSGKTTVSRIFHTLGIPVYDADTASKQIMNRDAEVKQQLAEVFGPSIFKDDQLDRQALAAIVFSDSAKLAQLNAIVHSATIAHAAAWMDAQNTPYVIKEAALIFESGSNKDLDYVIAVSSPLALRVSRTMARNQMTEAQVMERIKNQMDDEVKISKADFVIYNDEKQSLIQQVLQLHEHFLSLRK